MSDLGDGAVQPFLLAAGYEDLGAFLSETLGGAKADAGAAPGDDRDLTFKLLAHDHALYLRPGRLPAGVERKVIEDTGDL